MLGTVNQMAQEALLSTPEGPDTCTTLCAYVTGSVKEPKIEEEDLMFED